MWFVARCDGPDGCAGASSGSGPVHLTTLHRRRRRRRRRHGKERVCVPPQLTASGLLGLANIVLRSGTQPPAAATGATATGPAAASPRPAGIAATATVPVNMRRHTIARTTIARSRCRRSQRQRRPSLRHLRGAVPRPSLALYFGPTALLRRRTCALPPHGIGDGGGLPRRLGAAAAFGRRALVRHWRRCRHHRQPRRL
jgi:hypothetical protein